VLLGKLAFGRRKLGFEHEVEWAVREPAEAGDQPLLFVIDGEEIEWWDMFFRPSDRLLVAASAIELDGQPAGAGPLVIREHAVELPDGRVLGIEDIGSLAGRTREVTIPREAMGMGDVHLLGMIGAFFGWAGVFFSLFAACIMAIVVALIGRIGFGIRLPFGPFLALGAAAWLAGGWRLWLAYLEVLAGA
jgi:leader peptidase (prepilin peptidase)/N-methyltransferase